MSQEEGFANVVGNEDDGFFQAGSERFELALKLGARDGIEGAEGFIHEEDGRIGGESARYADALALSAGKFAGAAVSELARVEANKMEHFINASRDAAGLPFFQSGNEGDVLRDGEMREEARILDDVTNAAAEVNGVPFRGGTAMHENLAV